MKFTADKLKQTKLLETILPEQVSSELTTPTKVNSRV